LFYIPEWDGKTGLSIFALENHKLQEKVYAWKEKMDIIRDQIKEYENNKKKYVIDNADFIFKYFEDKKQISSVANKLPPKSSDKEEEKEGGSGIIEEESKNRKLLNDFFNIQKRKKGGEKVGVEMGEDSLGGGSCGGAVEKSSTTQKRKMHTYWKNVCDEIPNLQEYALSAEICTNCGKGEYIINEEEGTYNCHFCGHFILQYVNTPKHFNNEAPGEVTYTTYDRLIHFKEILSQFQAKETTKIPEEMVKNIANRIRKERIKDISEIDYDKMRDILRTLGYNHYFEHIQLINSIFGIEPPQMDKELYDITINKIEQKYGTIKKHNLINDDFLLYNFNIKFTNIIGNPPFGGTINTKYQDHLDKIYGNRMGNKIKKETYSFFVVKCMDLLSTNGELTFICSDTFLSINTMAGLRKYMVNNGSINIESLSYFSEETNYPMVILKII
jgi:tRNA1(Val) A37 N6-methylase TrmN6